MAHDVGGRAVLLVAGATFLGALAAAVRGVGRLFHSLGTDHGSPLTPGQTWLTVAGVVAGVAVTVVAAVLVVRDHEGFWFLAAAVVGVALSTVPLYLRDTTLDVTGAGFHRAHYYFNARDYR